MSKEIKGEVNETELINTLLVPLQESFQETTNDRMNSRIKRGQIRGNITLQDFIACPLIAGAVFTIAVGTPIAAAVQMANKDIGYELFGPILLTSFLGGVAYGLYSEIKLRHQKNLPT